MTRQPTHFISHGGGPWPWIENMRGALKPLEDSLADFPSQVPERPEAILMISGHWEAREVRVMHSARPPMLYDYYGFPRHTYALSYPAPGAPALAERAAGLIEAAGLPVALDDERGYDHGTFVPAYVMYPEADVPMFQVSMLETYDPEAHFALGRALAPLRDEGVAIVGSGLSYHNLRLFGPQAKVPSDVFDVWLNETLALPPAERTQRLLDWESAPYARICHAQED
ncbi:MAG: dioxygenase, partial [Maritimibacter sp.]|nr:dioxygenase [Maritimibacter sp.]